MKVITVASIKGGVGKSTLSINISEHLAQKYKILALDTDPQNSLTDYFLRDVDIEKILSKNLSLFFRGRIDFQETIHFLTDSLHCAPSTIDIATIGKELSSKPSAIFLLHDTLRELDYDFIIIDTPPAIDFSLHTSIMAADLVLIPFIPSRWTMRGIEIMKNEIAEIERLKGSRPKVLLIPYMVTETESSYIRGTDGFLDYYIPRSAAIRRSIDKGKSLKKDSVVWRSFENLTEEILKNG